MCSKRKHKRERKEITFKLLLCKIKKENHFKKKMINKIKYNKSTQCQVTSKTND